MSNFLPIIAFFLRDVNAAIGNLDEYQLPWAYAGVSLVIYIVLIFVGRILKRRIGLRLGWPYQLFALPLAFFLPSLHPKVVYPHWEEFVQTALILSAASLSISLLRCYLFEREIPGQSVKVPKFLSQIVSILIILAAVGVILQVVFHVEVPGLLAGAGVVGIVLGLALQDTLGNIFSGFAIYFGRQFKPGDWLQVGDHHAEVIEINWRSIRLRTEDDIYLDIPNSNITKETVVNFTHPKPLHAMRLQLGLEYDASPSRVFEVLTEAALAAPHVLKNPPPSVYLKDFAASSITYEIKFWINNHQILTEALSHIRTNLWYALRRNKITIPYPIQLEGPYEMPPEASDREAITREALHKVFFVDSLDASQLGRLVENAQVRRFGKHENIIRQGCEGSSMYVLVEGRAEVFVEQDGISRSVAQIHAGDCFGEMSLLTGAARSATIVASSDVVSVEIEKRTLAPIIEESPNLLEALSDLLAKRRMANEGVLSQSLGEASIDQKRRDYRKAFLSVLKTFFAV